MLYYNAICRGYQMALGSGWLAKATVAVGRSLVTERNGAVHINPRRAAPPVLALSHNGTPKVGVQEKPHFLQACFQQGSPSQH